MSKPTIWTKQATELLYELLVSKFGPYARWAMKTSPGNGLDKEYDVFCQRFAKTIGANSESAVKQQISFATQQPNGKTNTLPASHARVYILNKAAAFYAGFITNTDFPEVLLISDGG